MLIVALALILAVSPEAARHMGDASEALKRGMPALALEHARAAQEIQPELPEAHLAAAVALSDLDLLDEALAEYALAGPPADELHAAVASSVSRALLGKDRPSETRFLALEALPAAGEETKAELLATLALAEGRLLSADAAFAHAEGLTALAGAEAGRRVFDGLARAFLSGGDPVSACRAAARAAALSPAGAGKRRTLLLWAEAAYAARDAASGERALAALLASEPIPEEVEYARYNLAFVYGSRGHVVQMMRHVFKTPMRSTVLLMLGAGTLALAAVPAAAAMLLGRIRRRRPELAGALVATSLVLLIMTGIPYAVFVLNLPSFSEAVEAGEGESEEAVSVGLAPSVSSQLSANLLAVAVALALERRRGATHPLGLKKVGASRLFYTSAVAATACFSLLYLYSEAYAGLTGHPPPDAALVEILRAAGRPALIAWVGMFITVGAPVTEELIYRGLIYNRMRAALGPIAALVISSALFGASHAEPALLAPAAIVGAVMGLLYEATGSVLPPILAHCAFNAVSMSAALL